MLLIILISFDCSLIVWTQCKINFAESAKSLQQDFILGRLLVRDANHFLDEPQTIKL